MGGITDAIGGLFGGGPDLPQIGPQDILQPFTFGGFQGKFGPGGFTITPTGEKDPFLDQLRQAFGGAKDTLTGQIIPGFDQAFAGGISNIQDLIGKVQPGFGALTQATSDVFAQAKQNLLEQKDKASADLKSNLSQRGILGSSFAGQQLSQSEAQFQDALKELNTQEAQAQAANQLAELDTLNQLQQQELNLGLQQSQTSLQNLQTQLGLDQALAGVDLGEFDKILQIGASLLGAATGALGQASAANQALLASSIQGQGQFLGQIFGDPLSDLFGNLFGAIPGFG